MEGLSAASTKKMTAEEAAAAARAWGLSRWWPGASTTRRVFFSLGDKGDRLLSLRSPFPAAAAAAADARLAREISQRFSFTYNTHTLTLNPKS